MLDHPNYQHNAHVLRTITVSGDGKLELKPDLVELQIEVRTKAQDVTEAQRENAVIMNRVIQSLLTLNIARNDIQTAFYNVFPQYDFIEGKQVFRGYEVANAITVIIRNISEVGMVIDTAIKNGANQISQLTFKVENEESYYKGALQLALQNANEKAQAIAVSLRLTYVPQPIEIIEDTPEAPILFRTVAMPDQSFETPIEQGTITIDASVRVKYQF